METEEILIELTSNLEYKDFKKYWLFTMFRGKHYKRGPVLYLIINLLGLLMFGTKVILSGFDTLETGVFAFLLIVLLLMLYLMILAPKQNFKTYNLLKGSSINYKFFRDEVEIETIGASSNSISKIKYRGVYRVYEIDEYFYIYISNNQAFVIGKNNLPTENILILRSVLSNQVNKYFNYVKPSNQSNTK